MLNPPFRGRFVCAVRCLRRNLPHRFLLFRLPRWLAVSFAALACCFACRPTLNVLSPCLDRVASFGAVLVFWFSCACLRPVCLPPRRRPPRA
eukprot:5574919-Prymnesium_polylepis.1